MAQDNSQAKTKAPAKSARRRVRELMLQGPYQWLLSRNGPGMVEAHLQGAQDFSRADRAHFDTLLHGATREETTPTEASTSYLDHLVAELLPVERTALLVGAYELMYCVDIPYKVVINGAVELIKTLDGVEGYKYVNGVLNKLAARVHAVEVAARR